MSDPMSPPMPDAERIRRVPPGREIVSFRLALDKTGGFVNLKAKMADGKTEAMVLESRVALHVRDRIRETLRTRPGLETLPTDDAFFAGQPALDTADWNAMSAHVAVATGAHVETAPDGCILAFPFKARESGETVYTAYRMTPLHAAYFLHAINHAEESGELGRTSDKSGSTVH